MQISCNIRKFTKNPEDKFGFSLIQLSLLACFYSTLIDCAIDPMTTKVEVGKERVNYLYLLYLISMVLYQGLDHKILTILS